MRSSSIDAEGEEDDIAIQDDRSSDQEPEEQDAEDSDQDAEGEEVDEQDDDESEVVGPVKRAATRNRRLSNRPRKIEQSEDSASGGDDNSEASSDASSNNGNDWAEESDSAEEEREDPVGQNRCVYVLVAYKLKEPRTDKTLYSFCGEDEEHDPSEDFEENLTCAVCGDYGKSTLSDLTPGEIICTSGTRFKGPS